MNTLNTVSLATVASAAIAVPALAATGVDDLIAKIKSDDDAVRGAAWQNAGSAGASAVKPLAALLTHENFEVARSAKRALLNIVHHAGRPGAEKEGKAVGRELIAALTIPSAPARREILWMLSEIGGKEAVAPMAKWLTDPDVREDARCALMRIPGSPVTSALSKAFKTAPEEFKYALAESLRQRGEKVNGYPSKKLTPTKQTSVTAVRVN